MATKNKGGRPKVEIDKVKFVEYCELQCTLMEIASMFDCSHDTIEKWCKKEFKMTFGEAFEKYRGKGLMSLRRKQFALAERNATMAIWLGKQVLGQKDIITFNNLDDSEDDPLTASMKAEMGIDNE